MNATDEDVLLGAAVESCISCRAPSTERLPNTGRPVCRTCALRLVERATAAVARVESMIERETLARALYASRLGCYFSCAM